MCKRPKNPIFQPWPRTTDISGANEIEASLSESSVNAANLKLDLLFGPGLVKDKYFMTFTKTGIFVRVDRKQSSVNGRFNGCNARYRLIKCIIWLVKCVSDNDIVYAFNVALDIAYLFSSISKKRKCINN